MITRFFNIKRCFFLVVLLCIACNPEDIPEPTKGTPVFSVNTSAFDITAGDEDFYLFTSFEKDSLNVFEFISSFEKLRPDCGNDCQERLRIIIRDDGISPTNSTDVVQALMANLSYKFGDVSNTEDIIRYLITATTQGTGSFNFKYRINDGAELQGTDLFSTTVERLQSDPINKISLEVTDTFGCTSFVEKRVTDTGQTSCAVEIFGTLDTIQDSILLIAQATGAGPFNYNWTNGVQEDTNYYAILQQQVNVAEVVVLDNQQCESRARVGIYSSMNTSPNQRLCSSTVDVSIDTILTNDLQLSTVVVEYTTPEGVTYSSERIEQNANNFFSISDIEDFDANENGEATKKMRIDFNCLLQAQDSSLLQVNNGVGIISIAHPD